MKISEVTGDRIDNVTKLNIIKEEEKIIEEELQELKKVEEELDKAEELRKSADDLADRALDLTADTMAQPPASDVTTSSRVSFSDITLLTSSKQTFNLYENLPDLALLLQKCNVITMTSSTPASRDVTATPANQSVADSGISQTTSDASSDDEQALGPDGRRGQREAGSG